MKRIRMELILGVGLATGFLAAGVASAHVGGKANVSYVGDSSGHLVTDSLGNCVKTGAWTKELALADCDPSVTPKKAETAPAVKAAPRPAPAPVAEKITLRAGALFDVGKADLKAAGQRELDDLAAKIKGMTDLESIGVTGHTDNRGDAGFNQRLSEQRAATVKAYLVDKGVDGNKISTRGMGASQPAATNTTAEGRAQNRRVELDIKARR